MTLDEMARKAGHKETSTLRHAIRRRTLAATKAGNTWLVEEHEAARWIAERRPGRPATKGTPAPAE